MGGHKKKGTSLIERLPLEPFLGPELVLNGDFDDDSIWSWGLQWTWLTPDLLARWRSNAPFQEGHLEQSIAIEEGKLYRVTFDVTFSRSWLAVELGGTTVHNMLATTGSFSYDVNAGAIDNVIDFIGSAELAGKITRLDNVSVKQWLP